MAAIEDWNGGIPDVEHKERRRREFVAGTKTWTSAETNGDHRAFFVEYVVPLRELCREGLFESAQENCAAIDGELHICGIEITGAKALLSDQSPGVPGEERPTPRGEH